MILGVTQPIFRLKWKHCWVISPRRAPLKLWVSFLLEIPSVRLVPIGVLKWSLAWITAFPQLINRINKEWKYAKNSWLNFENRSAVYDPVVSWKDSMRFVLFPDVPWCDPDNSSSISKMRLFTRSNHPTCILLNLEIIFTAGNQWSFFQNVIKCYFGFFCPVIINFYNTIKYILWWPKRYFGWNKLHCRESKQRNEVPAPSGQYPIQVCCQLGPVW